MHLFGLVCSFAGCVYARMKYYVPSKRLSVVQIGTQLQKVVSSSLDAKRFFSEIHIHYLGAHPQLLHALKHLLNLTDKSLLRLRTPMVGAGQGKTTLPGTRKNQKT